jgi:hypothetical protein
MSGKSMMFMLPAPGCASGCRSSDQNLREAVLGPLGGASVYGYDTMERYGPLFLNVWVQVGAPSFLHPEN